MKLNSRRRKLYAVNLFVAACLVIIFMYALSWYQAPKNFEEIQKDQQALEQLKDKRANDLADKILNHADDAQEALNRLTKWDQDYARYKFNLPDEEELNTDASLQLYHPLGGGLQMVPIEDDIYAEMIGPERRGWHYQNHSNVEWSETGRPDVIMSFIDIHPVVCAIINERLYGNADIPATTLNYAGPFILNKTNSSFSAKHCPACKNKDSYCVQNSDTYAFYKIIASH